MSPSRRRHLSIAATTVVASLTFAAGAQAACAPDAFEPDSATAAAAITPGATVQRAICQAPTPFPRTQSAIDFDWFGFTATAGQTYTFTAINVGAALANDAFDRGGLQLSDFSKVEADGSLTPVAADVPPNGDQLTTPALAAGRYVFSAATYEQQIYPETNTQDVKTVQGPDGGYGIRMSGAAAGGGTAPAPAPGGGGTTPAPDPTSPPAAQAPAVTGLTLSRPDEKGGKPVGATLQLSAPAPSGGTLVDVTSSDPGIASVGPVSVPSGATRVSFEISTAETGTDRSVTITAGTAGGSRSVVLVVKR